MILDIEENLTPEDRIDYIYLDVKNDKYMVLKYVMVENSNYVLIASVTVPSGFTKITKNNFSYKD